MAINSTVFDQVIKPEYALYGGDCVEVMSGLPDASVGMSVYSPPFGGLYQYSSSEQDLSNAISYEKFFEHYDFVVKELHRLTKPGRMTCVHVMDVPRKGDRGLRDFPGDVIRQHERIGFDYWARYAIWKEPLRVAIRTRSKGLTHRQIVKDSSLSNNAGADYLLVFRKPGENKEPIDHPGGLQKYCGEREVPESFMGANGKAYPARAFMAEAHWKDPQTNKLAHWIWQQYASSFWDDIRISRVLSYKGARDSDEEKHVHPLQLDVIERTVLLWSNPGDIVFTPFMGVGSEVYGAVVNGRKGVGVELKKSYFRQAVKNIADAGKEAVEMDLALVMASVDDGSDESEGI